jgi:hypothetical protein
LNDTPATVSLTSQAPRVTNSLKRRFSSPLGHVAKKDKDMDNSSYFGTLYIKLALYLRRKPNLMNIKNNVVY